MGRLVLELFGVRDALTIRYSDAVCTALQLTNFYQDVSIDIQKNRIYISLDEIEKFGVSLNQFQLKENSPNLEKLLKYQVDRTKDLFTQGQNIVDRLPANLKKQIKMTILGGVKILDKIEYLNYKVINYRPKLSKIDYLKIFIKAMI